MNKTLERIRLTTNDIFASSEPKLPVPSMDWKRKLEALEAASLTTQRDKMLLDMRAWQAEKMGFTKVTVPEAVTMLMGQPPTHETTVKDESRRQVLEWMYCHHEDKAVEGDECTWVDQPHQYYRMEKGSLWHVPPFARKEAWRVQYGMLNYLRREIPHGVVLRLLECKALKLFNAFQVLAPMDAWLTDADIDPIIIGEIWEKPRGKNTSGREERFFVAQWGQKP